MMPCHGRRGPARHCRRHVQPRRIGTAVPAARRRNTACPPTTTTERATCTVCGTIHYENPLNVVGTVPVWREQVLLCRRASAALRLDALPAGFMDSARRCATAPCAKPSRKPAPRSRCRALHAAQRGARRCISSTARSCSTRFDPGPETIEAPALPQTRSPERRIAFRTVKGNPGALVRRPPPGSIRLPRSISADRCKRAHEPNPRPRTPPGHQGRHAAPARDLIHPDPLLDYLVEVVPPAQPGRHARLAVGGAAATRRAP